jgi:hypothetical protein
MNNLRILYVPTEVDYETMRKHGVRLMRDGYTVQFHGHSSNRRCDLGPDGVARSCGVLTLGEEDVILVPSRASDDNN